MRVAFALALGLGALVALEGTVRVLGRHVRSVHLPRSSDPKVYEYDATKGWFHVPGSSGQSFLGGPDPGSVRINSLGLRGGEISHLPGQRRVLVFGDSFGFGVGVDEEHLVSTQLQALLDASSAERFEVVNMSVSGYSTDQELILMRELGLGLRPEAVILLLCDNDFVGNVEDFSYQRYYKPYFVLDRSGELRLENSPVPRLETSRQAKLWLAEHSNLWNLLRTRHSDDTHVQAFLDWFQVRRPRSAPERSQVRVTLALIQSFHDLAASVGSSLVVMNTGHRGETRSPFLALRPQLTRAGISWIAFEPLLEAARRREPRGDWDFPGNAHWNRDAHRLAAQVLDTWLEAGGLPRPGVRLAYADLKERRRAP